jgi:hypothetical protein
MIVGMAIGRLRLPVTTHIVGDEFDRLLDGEPVEQPSGFVRRRTVEGAVRP